MKHLSTVTAFAAALAGLAAVSSAETYRVLDGGANLRVTTRNVQAEFARTDLSRLANRLTGETYTAQDASLQGGLARVRIGGSGGVRPGPGRWRMAKGEYGAVYEALAAHEEDAAFRMLVSAEDGEVVIRCEARFRPGNVAAVAWGVNGLSLDRSSAVLPVRGGRVLSAESAGASEEFDYPTHWEAQFAVIEGRRGSALIYSTDRNARFKRLRYWRARSAYQLVFETENQAPFAGLQTARSVEWRVDCVPEGWKAAVSAYKNRVRRSGGVLYNRPAVAANQTWPRRIRAVARVGGDYADTAILDELARHLDPAATLLYFYDWRRDGYDINYPDYTGRPGLAEFTRHAQNLGFRVMYHVDLPGVTPSHPVYEDLKRHQVRDAFSGQPVGWLWDKDVPQRFAFINPASAAFRRVFVDAMRGIVRDYAPDAVHLDVSGPMWNDANGLIDGMNYCQGSVRLHRELLSELPNLVLGGESVNELLAPFEHFVQRWAWNCDLDPHPVCEYLFGDTTKSYGYLGQPNPDHSPSGFIRYVRVYERQGVVPSAVVDSVKDMTPDRVGAMRWFRVIRAWQRNNLVPDWERDWGRETLFAFRGDGGVRAQIERIPHGVRMTCARDLLYERVEGVRRVRTRGHIHGHPAYGPGEAFGLDPDRSYWIEGGPPDFGAPHITSLSDGVLVERWRADDKMVVASFGPTLADVLLDMVRESGRALNGVSLDGVRGPLERGAEFRAAEGSVRGKQMTSILAHPPWLAPPGRDANPGGETFALYTVALPPLEQGRCVLRFAVGISDAAKDTDGVTFVVRVAEREVFRRHIEKESAWQLVSIDLSEHAGRSVDIELITSPGPALNTSWDHALWGEPRVVLERAEERLDARIVLPREPLGRLVGGERADARAPVIGLTASAIDDAGSYADVESKLPCSIFFYFSQPHSVEPPCDLTRVGFDAGLVINGVHSLGSAWGGGKVGQAEINGRQYPSISGHPPSHGLAVMSWLLALPDAPVLKLKFTAGISPNASTEGVGFSVSVNGERLWDLVGTSPGSWDGEVDLSEYAGRVVVLELVTDSLGEAFCDWAHWVNPVILASRGASNSVP